MSRGAVTVRAIEPADLEAVVSIDEKLAGQTRKDYWRVRFDIAALRPPWMSSVAEADGRVVGFLFGWVGSRSSVSRAGQAGSTSAGRRSASSSCAGVEPSDRRRGPRHQDPRASRAGAFPAPVRDPG